MRRLTSRLGAMVGVLACQLALAQPIGLDERVNRLASELRCLVCQNQTVADSQAELAQQLKLEVRKQLASGASDQQVRDFMVARYGEFVLYNPRLTPGTVWLWVAPAGLLGVGLVVLGWQVRASRLRATGASDHADEEARATLEGQAT